MRFFGKTTALGAVAGLAVFAIGCGNDDSSPTSPTRTPAAPTVTERYVGAIPVGGSGFYSFSVAEYGTVNVTLTAVSGIDDSSVGIGLGLGTPAGFGCTATATLTATPSTTPQFANPYEAGIYCVRVYDAGTLTGSMMFDVTIAHP